MQKKCKIVLFDTQTDWHIFYHVVYTCVRALWYLGKYGVFRPVMSICYELNISQKLQMYFIAFKFWHITYFNSLWTYSMRYVMLVSMMSSQDEHYEDEEEGGEAGILGSSFSRRNAEVQDLPESEDMFLPSDMDDTQLTFRFKEVTVLSFHLEIFIFLFKVISIHFPCFVSAPDQTQHRRGWSRWTQRAGKNFNPPSYV